jgi:hypothetical protein
MNELELEKAITDVYERGGSPEFICIRGAWLHISGLVLDGDELREITPHEVAIVRPWIEMFLNATGAA